MKFAQVLAESNRTCKKCGGEMEVVKNDGLADANEYRCKKCGESEIVGWEWPMGKK